MDNLLERVEALEHHLQTLQTHTHAVERRLRWWPPAVSPGAWWSSAW
jgi:hypothetical protein